MQSKMVYVSIIVLPTPPPYNINLTNNNSEFRERGKKPTIQALLSKHLTFSPVEYLHLLQVSHIIQRNLKTLKVFEKECHAL